MSVGTLPMATTDQRLARLSLSVLPPPRAADELREAPARDSPQKGARGRKHASEQSVQLEKPGRRDSSLTRHVGFRVSVPGPSWQLGGYGIS